MSAKMSRTSVRLPTRSFKLGDTANGLSHSTNRQVILMFPSPRLSERRRCWPRQIRLRKHRCPAP
eukprot:483108-Amphidinium_carterae.1